MVSGLSFRFLKDILWMQWIAGTAVMMIVFVVGLSVGWSSPYLAQFESGDSPIPATADEISWIALLYELGRLPGAILGAVGIQYFGSKTMTFGVGCAFLISWILVILGNSVSWIFVARFICGASTEAAYIAFPLYLGDISSSQIRGALVIFAANGAGIGILAGNAMGHYLSMKLFAWITLVPNVCFLLVFLWIPQSPYYLLSKGRTKDAETSVLRYNPKANVQLEVESIKEFLALSNSSTFIGRLRELNIPRNRKATIMIAALIMFGHYSGVNPVGSYMESIMTRGMVTIIAPSTVPLIVNGIGIIAGWTLMYLAEKFGRRIMWIVSSAGVCCSMTALGTHFYLLDDGFDPARLQWLPISSILLFTIFFKIGMSSIASILFAELFAANIQPLVGLVTAITSAIFGFTAIYGYQFLLELIDEAYVWWIHAIFMSISLVVGLVYVPETKGKTLLEIQGDLMKN